MMRRNIALFIFIGITILLVAGCFGGRQVEEEPIAPLRSPHPTFTPTPVQPPSPTPPAPAAVGESQAPMPSENASGQPAQAPVPGVEAQTVLGVLNDDLVNIRRGPGLQYPPIRLGMRGDQFTITGRSADDEWWRICCVEEQPAWVYQSFVDVDGPVDAVPVVDADDNTGGPMVIAPTPTPPPAPQPPPQSVPTAPPQESSTEALPAEPTAPLFPFALVAQEQFPESNPLVRIFLYVYEGDRALPGYSLRVSKDGVDLSVSALSSDAAGLTWPITSPRQRFQNMKVEFPEANPAGVWVVQLVDGGGAAVGPAATFTLGPNDTNRELYVRYEKQ
ncbi:MAG: SH3 domain-containing protein [Caldilinea sp.]|nr:SH3 domain-containing protein [Caldilinea sp.]MDW8442259.1 SH3 domain-containing protein [Caldilineaceae bacterium]